jgi:hypothetical protein
MDDSDRDRYGAFRVLDSGVPVARRYAVVEDTDQGPILKAGPFDSIDEARTAAQALAANDEAADDPERRRRDHRDDGDDNGGSPPPRKAIGGCH